MIKLTLSLFTILFLFGNALAKTTLAKTVFAQTPAAAETTLEPEAKLIITEVNFKNTEADWIEIYYSSPGNKALNLNGISFADDAVFKIINDDLIIQSNQYLLLYFKNSSTDQPPYFYTKRDGLTGSSEQFIIYDQNNKILDAICWASSKPTAAEIIDLTNLHALNGWNSADMASCLQSAKVSKNSSIARITNTDTNSQADWLITKNPTPGHPNDKLTTTTKEQTAQKSPKTTKTKKIVKKKSKNSSAKKPAYHNGDLSSDIIISELLPNPPKNDNKTEWIELYNQGKTDVKLGNWQLDDGENGSKPYIFPDQIIIKGQNTTLVPITTSKLSLGNKEDTVRLYNYNGKIIHEISYEEAPNGKSYALINIIKQDDKQKEAQWQWVSVPSPDAPNPIYEELIAEISSEPQFGEIYFFEVKADQNHPQKIIFDEATIAGPLARATFTKNSRIKMLLERANNDTYRLKNYEILSIPATRPTKGLLIGSIIGTIIMVTGIIIYIFRKRLFPLRFKLLETLKK